MKRTGGSATFPEETMHNFLLIRTPTCSVGMQRMINLITSSKTQGCSSFDLTAGSIKLRKEELIGSVKGESFDTNETAALKICKVCWTPRQQSCCVQHDLRTSVS